jgi:hypothetical protein
VRKVGSVQQDAAIQNQNRHNADPVNTQDLPSLRLLTQRVTVHYKVLTTVLLILATRWVSLITVLLRLLVDDVSRYDLWVCGNLYDGLGFEHENMRFCPRS